MRSLLTLIALLASVHLSLAAAEPDLDRLFEQSWSADGITPAPVSSDAEFLRRVSLDLTWRLPSAEEAAAFLSDDDPAKRSRLIDRLLASPEHAEALAKRWEHLLLGYDRLPRFVSRPALRAYFIESFASNKPLDRIVSELLASEGQPQTQGAVNYVARFGKTPTDLASHSARTFLGLQIQCAQCHHHPYEAWSQEDFYGYAAFFSQMRRGRAAPSETLKAMVMENLGSFDGGSRKEAMQAAYAEMTRTERREFRRERARMYALQDQGARELEAEIDGTTRTFAPKFLDADETVPIEGRYREALAEWLTEPGNPWFARAMVNRTWEQYFGRGLVHPVDDIGFTRPDQPRVLDALTAAFVEQGFDLAWLERTILESQVYQLSSAGPEPRPGTFARASIRDLEPVQLFEVLLAAVDVESSNLPAKIRDYEERKNRFVRRFVHTFDTDDPSAQEAYRGTIPQELFFQNGILTTEATRVSTNSRLLLRTLDAPSDTARIRRLYLSTLTREPTEEEAQRCRDYFAQTDSTAAAVEDLLWTLLNTPEFRFNH